ncbi:MAG TPA: nucleotidyltransferase domain-containing protein [Gemmatimonadales bacterium]|nr:nucleotidyltransferase domain-containing protein [Gemmatimonadales bacterium]
MAGTTKPNLEQFAQRLEAALGDNLVALLLFGSAARGTHVEGRSDLNVLVIVKDAGVLRLHAATPVLAEWAKAGEPAPLVFAEAEWRASADVFPIEIEDMREAHRVLAGRDPFEGVATRRADLRRELEHELRGKVLRLRTEYAAAAADGKALGRLLVHSAGTFFILFRATLRLLGGAPPADHDALVRETAAAAGLDISAFDWVLAALGGKDPKSLEAYDAVAGRYVDAMEALADFVDRLET